MKINVENKHIENGLINCSHCPVALALKDAGFKRADVCATVMYVDGARIEPPFIVTDFVRRFDRHFLVKPFSFDIDMEVPADAN